jgi:hypothetical protein
MVVLGPFALETADLLWRRRVVVALALYMDLLTD